MYTFPKHPTPHVYQYSLTEVALAMYNRRDAEGLKAEVLRLAEELKTAEGDQFKLTLGQLTCTAGLLDSLSAGGRAVMALCDYVNF